MMAFADEQPPGAEPIASSESPARDAGWEAPPEAEAPSPGAIPPSASRPPRGGLGFRLESVLIGLVVMAGIVGIGVALGAILTSQHVAGWIIGLVVAIVSVLLSSMLWSSRRR